MAQEDIKEERPILEPTAKTGKITSFLSDHGVIFDSIPAMIWCKDTQNNFIRVNRSAAAAIGKSPRLVEGRSAYELFPDEAEEYFRNDREVVESGQPKMGIVERLQTADGKKMWVQTDKLPLKDEAGVVRGVLVFVVDITDRKNTEERLMESEERYRTAIEHSNDGVALVKGGRHIYVNSKFIEIFGYEKPQDMIGTATGRGKEARMARRGMSSKGYGRMGKRSISRSRQRESYSRVRR